MSYNLMAEGDLDLFELGNAASQYEPLELFPIAAAESWVKPGAHSVELARDALGIAIPTSRCGPEAAAALRTLVERMWAKDVVVFDLYTGDRIATPEELAEVEARIGA
jgi:hypothetical protein